MPPQKGCHPIVNCLVVSIVREFIHGGELVDDFTTLLDEGVNQRFVTSMRKTDFAFCVFQLINIKVSKRLILALKLPFLGQNRLVTCL